MSDQETSQEMSPSGPYFDRLLPDDRVAYRAASGDLDITEEIRLMRAVLAYLAEDIPTNHRAMSAILGALVRAIYIQAKQLAGASDVERTLQDAADLVLHQPDTEEQV